MIELNQNRPNAFYTNAYWDRMCEGNSKGAIQVIRDISDRSQQDTICAKIANRHLKQQCYEKAVQVIELSSSRAIKNTVYLTIAYYRTCKGKSRKVIRAIRKISSSCGKQGIYISLATICIQMQKWAAATALAACIENKEERDSICMQAYVHLMCSKNWGKIRKLAVLVTDSKKRDQIYRYISEQFSHERQFEKAMQFAALIIDEICRDNTLYDLAQISLGKNWRISMEAASGLKGNVMRDRIYPIIMRRCFSNKIWIGVLQAAAQLHSENRDWDILTKTWESLYKQREEAASKHLFVT